MNNKSGLSIYFFLAGAVLCLIPILILPTSDLFGISVQSASELIPAFAKVDHNQTLQLEMPIYWIRQSFIPFFANISPIYSQLYSWIGLIGLFILALGIKQWANISNKQFYLGMGIWIAIAIFKATPSSLFPIPSFLIPNTSNLTPYTSPLTPSYLFLITSSFLLLPSYIIPLPYSLILCLISLVALSILSSQTFPHLILQFGRKAQFQKTKKVYSLLYLFLLIDLALGLYLQEAGNIPKPEFMIALLCIQWAIFWFQIVSNPVLQQYKLQFLGVYLLAIPGIVWFYLHFNDPAIRFVYECNFRSMLVMAILFPAFIYTNFKEIFHQNLAIHTVVFKAHRIKLYLYQIGVLIIGLAWTFASNASLYHVLLAGYYNQIGDIETQTGKPQLAIISYQTAQANSRLNLKSNFELANRSTSDEEKAQYLSYTLTRRPHPLTYLSLGTIYKNNDHHFQALFTLEEGFEKFPESIELATAIAIQYEKLNQPKEAQQYYELAYHLNDKNPLAVANLMYANKHLKNSVTTLEKPSEQDLGYRSNQLANALLGDSKNVDPPLAQFQFQNNVQHFAYLYNASIYWKSKMQDVKLGPVLKNETYLQTFPELNLVDAWQDFYHGKRLQSLQKISFLKETYAGKEANPYEQLFYFWHNTLNEPIQSTESLKGTPEQLLEKFPFSVDLQNKYFPILNAQKKDKIAYEYALAGIQFNPNKAELYPNYILQAIQLSELSYAEEAKTKLKGLNSDLYTQFANQFESKRKEIQKKRSTW